MPRLRSHIRRGYQILNKKDMGLNAIIKSLESTEDNAAVNRPQLNDKEREYAERIFFEKELREINPGMSDIKIRGRIVRAIAVAQMLYKEIYGL